MPGLGGWWHYWRRNDDGRSDPTGRFACGILAWKQELDYNGFIGKVVLSLPYFGEALDTQVRAAQTKFGLTADGVIGPKTGAALARKRKMDVGAREQIPNDYLCKLISLESANDPVAQGYSDPNDEGYAQIHLPYHTSVTPQQAWSPSFAVPWAADYLVSAYVYVKDWDGAVASYNQGQTGAKKWVDAGKPKYGAPYTDSLGTPRDHFSDCLRYVTLVQSAAC